MKLKQIRTLPVVHGTSTACMICHREISKALEKHFEMILEHNYLNIDLQLIG